MTKSPRLYNRQNLSSGAALTIDGASAHYLHNVMRMKAGDALRLFNENDGEFAAIITESHKKSVTLKIGDQRRAPETPKRRVHLFFAPLKKNRMDFMIEKAVELGVTDFHPILTDHTEVRKLKTERLHSQIIEAAEQCERMNMPTLHDMTPLITLITRPPESIILLACLERHDGEFIDTALTKVKGDVGFIIGPVGGFSEKENTKMLETAALTPISLGSDILRAETASIFCLAKAKTT